MAGYFMGVVHSISDAEAFGAYQQVAEPTLAKYGGKMVLLSSGVEAGDGDWSPMGIVLFEFKSGRQARKWYNSPEYQASSVNVSRPPAATQSSLMSLSRLIEFCAPSFVLD